MKMKIEFSMDNAAFEDDYAGHEVARILEKLAGQCKHLNADGIFTIMDEERIMDVNGNTAGQVTVDPEIEEGD